MSLKPLLKDPAAKWDRPAVTQVNRRREQKTVMGYSLRTERYRYTMWEKGAEGEELYDYDKDPRELKNLCKEPASAKLKAELRAKLDSILAARQRA